MQEFWQTVVAFVVSMCVENPGPDIGASMGTYSVFHLLIVLIILGVFVYPVCRIVGKAGYSPLLGLLWFIPLVNLAMLWVFAFSDWPIQRRERSAG